MAPEVANGVSSSRSGTDDRSNTDGDTGTDVAGFEKPHPSTC